MFKPILLVMALAAGVASGAAAADVSVSEQTFGCILDWPKVRNTRINHADPKQLAEAMRIFRDSVRHGISRRHDPAAGAFRGHGETSARKIPQDERLGVFRAGGLRGGHQDPRSRRRRRQSLRSEE